MEKQQIKNQIVNLQKSEESILFKLATDHKTDPNQINFIIKKVFELSNLILRLKTILKEIRNNET
tara:strand:+ start:1949 stop:2143 length:195 start_codon:yes stop_codon:yes gene_type:complete